MGLSMCRSIIEAHGVIWASSNVGPGATFTFTVPPPGDIVLTGRPTPPCQGKTRPQTLVLVADRAAWRVPVPDPRGRATVEAARGGGDA